MRKLRPGAFALSVILFSGISYAAGPLTFHRAMELAVQNSAAMQGARADELQAHAALKEARAQYLPQMQLGSGLAYSNGFPLSIEGAAPSIFNVNSNQFLFNPAQKQFVHAARSDYSAAEDLAADRRSQVLLDAAATYMALDNALSSLKIVQQQLESTSRAEDIVKQRFQAGLDPEVEYTKARLNSARAQMASEKTKSDVDLLTLHLAQLTGLKANEIEIVTESVPQLPPLPPEDSIIQKAVTASAAVRAADEQAQAKLFNAAGEHKQLYPALDLAGQYGLLARYNNYDEFFRKFQRHNVTFGVVIRFPFLNFAQQAKADEASAAAVRAKADAQIVKEQVATEVTRLQRAVRQLSAARDVAKLEYQIASTDDQAMAVKVQSGTATLKDQEGARAEEASKYQAMLGAQLELDKAQLQLMRATGDLESWALGH